MVSSLFTKPINETMNCENHKAMNYFHFFDLPVSFLLDEKVLKKRFLQNSKKFHPDFYTLENEEKQAEILELSTLNNNAFKTLRDFDTRMAYILRELNILEDEGKNTIPQAFLLQVMEIQEAIMELEFGFDDNAYHSALKQANDLENDLRKAIQPSLDAFDLKKTGQAELKKIKEFYLKKKYLWRIKENLNRFAPALNEA